jgi:hypothetical protein
MKITDEDKKLIYERYMEWCSIVADDLEDKTWFTAEELVGWESVEVSGRGY